MLRRLSHSSQHLSPAGGQDETPRINRRAKLSKSSNGRRTRNLFNAKLQRKYLPTIFNQATRHKYGPEGREAEKKLRKQTMNQYKRQEEGVFFSSEMQYAMCGSCNSTQCTLLYTSPSWLEANKTLANKVRKPCQWSQHHSKRHTYISLFFLFLRKTMKKQTSTQATHVFQYFKNV